ncbi:hypothetical protein U1Q18_004634 [Sarracenia purpurea var. burkii]
MSQSLSSLDHNLSADTIFFGIKLWILIVAGLLAFLVLILVIFCVFFFSCRRQKPRRVRLTTLKSVVSNNFHSAPTTTASLDRRLLSRNGMDMIEMSVTTPEKLLPFSGQWPIQASERKSDLMDLESVAWYSRTVSEARRGNQVYPVEEIEVATNGFADENVIGSGDCGIVYRGVLYDGMRVAVKKLLYDSGKAEIFIEEMEAIGSARHKNVVKLLGYCTCNEGSSRMLVYEYIDNGNLHQWLHGCIRQVSPLTWNIRMNIIQAAAKGLAYLHEDVEPKIVHQHIKSSNILLDHQWNPKISDLGIAKVLGPAWSHIAASSMGMSGYMAPEYAYTGAFDEKTDVYSFGILLMEIITGKTPLEYSTGTKPQVYLIDWLKSTVAKQKFDQIVDPKISEKPSLKELKRIVLIALRCVDPDVENRPRMGDVIHMLEPRDLLLSDV